jgi:hypothetical protein
MSVLFVSCALTDGYQQLMNCKDSESWEILRNMLEKYEPDVYSIFHITDGCLLLKLCALYIVLDFFFFPFTKWGSII